MNLHFRVNEFIDKFSSSHDWMRFYTIYNITVSEHATSNRETYILTNVVHHSLSFMLMLMQFICEGVYTVHNEWTWRMVLYMYKKVRNTVAKEPSDDANLWGSTQRRTRRAPTRGERTNTRNAIRSLKAWMIECDPVTDRVGSDWRRGPSTHRPCCWIKSVGVDCEVLSSRTGCQSAPTPTIRLTLS